MKKAIAVDSQKPEGTVGSWRDVTPQSALSAEAGIVRITAPSHLDELVRQGAQRMLEAALETEVDQFLERHAAVRDEGDRRRVVRNGFLPARRLLTGAGPLEVRQPRARDHRPAEERVTFSSAILPPYLRRSRAIDELLPWLYLKGVSTGDFQEALQALLGPEASGLSANVVTRLVEQWQEEHAVWCRRDLSKKQYVYFWVDGIYVNVRLDGERQCLLIVMGATVEGHKELVAVQDGIREDEQSWYELLVDLKQRGLKTAPKLVVGDGALGFWKAVRKVFPKARAQRCWVHKEANVLSKLPKGIQPAAKRDLHSIWMAETRDAANQAFDTFLEKYGAKYPKATECLAKDRDDLLAFYDFPAEHWLHLRTTNPIESTFATVRLRHRRTKGNGTRRASLAMVFKLSQSAARRWRRLNGHEQIGHLQEGKCFVNGILQPAA
jgi:transposase-like protein